MNDKTFTLDGIQELRKAGLYFLYKEDVLVYIGVSKNVYVRILEHSFEGNKEFDSVKTLMQSEESIYDITELMEVFFINKYMPKYNKLVVKDTFSFYYSLPSSIISNKNKSKDSFSKLNDIVKRSANDVHLKGYER